MKTTRVIYGTHDYVLAPGQDVIARAQMVDAIQAGGGVIHLETVSDGSIALLISAGVHIIFENVGQDDDEEPVAPFDPSPGHLSLIEWDL